MLGKLKVFGSN